MTPAVLEVSPAESSESSAAHRAPRLLGPMLLAILLVHAGLLAWTAWRHSPTWDEFGHLVAGISHWEFGTFDLYRVNPPLVRSVAAIPMLYARPLTDWRAYDALPGARSEREVREQFTIANGPAIFWLHTLARWACIPFSLLGAYVCFRWASDLYGGASGLVAACLWCFSPNILAHGHLMTPDVGAAALGAAAAYLFWRWLRRPGWLEAILAGVALGAAELTKTTWLLLFPLWPLVWLAWRWPQRASLSRHAWRRQALQTVAIPAIALGILNLGYGFEGSMTRLGDHRFLSDALGGPRPPGTPANAPRNRFAGTWLGAIPVPLPANYLAGIDLQKGDFEGKMMSYLRGEWREGGWWYYYLYGLAVKEPLGTWALVALAAALGLFVRGYAAPWRDELVLLLPAVAVLALVSSQTGFNHHLRYVVPALPFVYVWASKVARAVPLKHGDLAILGAAALAFVLASSLSVYPHTLSYFNELAGGPMQGHAHMGNSNTDWGQDLLYLKRWLDKHPEVPTIGLAYDCPLIDPALAGIDATSPPFYEPRPGSYVISVNQMRSSWREYGYFRRMTPVATIGYSMYVYHVTPEEADRVRREVRSRPTLPQPADNPSDGPASR